MTDGPAPVEDEVEGAAAAKPQAAPTVTRRGVAKNLVVVAIFLLFTLVVGVAFAYFGSSSVPGGNGASAATTVRQGATPTVTADIGSVTVSWAAATLASGPAVTGYTVRRYDAATLTAQTILSACNGTLTATTCTESGLPTGQWRYSVTPTVGTGWTGAESAKSANVATVEKDGVAPVNAVSLTGITPSALKTSNTVYYRGSSAGSVTFTNAVTDSGSGPASSTSQALTGTVTGWTHTPSTVSTPQDGPYVSNPFSWAAGTTSGPVEALVGRDVQKNATTTTLTFVNDSTNPSASVSYGNGYESGRSVAVSFTASDAGSGLAATRQLQRSAATLTNGVCGTGYSTFSRVGPLNPTSSYSDNQVSNGNCYKYRYVVTDLVGNQTIATSPNVTRVDYAGAVTGTTGLLSQWRLGEKLAVSDTFTGTTGAALSSRTGETGATWTKWLNDIPNAVLTSDDRLRRNGTGGVTYLASGTPPTANYQVSVDVVLKSQLSGDYAGVVGRVLVSDTTGQGTRYSARYSTDSDSWELLRIVNGNGTVLGSPYSQILTTNQAYRLTLDMRGTTIRLLVNGVERVSSVDSGITATGIAGVRLGAGNTGSAPTSYSGMHVDNFKVTPRAADSKGANPGTYVNQPTLGFPGAIAGDSDTAAVFDGTEDYVQMVNTSGIPVGASVRSVETWFKTSSSARQVLFSYGSRGTAQEFGLWLDPGGASLTAWGYAGDKGFPLPAPVNDGAWHYVVKTYDGSALTVYIDGVALPAQTATRSTVLDSYGFGIGAVITPGDGNSGGFFKGALDEVSFYTTALNQATVTSHYQLGTSPVPDVTGPTGGSVDASGLVGTGSRYAPSTTLDLNLAPGTDPSDLADTGAQLLRATATLSSDGGVGNGVCGTMGGYSPVDGGTDPPPAVSDTVADQACYSYRYLVPDSLGNTTTYTSPDIKVDTTAPAAPDLAFSAGTNASSTGSTLFYRPAASGSFTLTADATDAGSGIASYAFPALGTGWTTTAGALGVATYSWTPTPAAPGTKNVTATNNATGVSPGTPFSVTADNAPPSAGTVSYPSTSADTSVDVAFTTGSDADSGVGTRLLQRATATLTGTTCGTFGAFTTVTNGTNPTSPLANTVASGNCYAYQYVVADNVGNRTTAASDTVLRVRRVSYFDTVSNTAGLASYWRLGENPAGTSDTFTGTSGTALSAHQADSGASWTRRPNDTITAVLSNQGRLRKSSASGGVGYYTSDVPTSPDYLVQADLYVKSVVGTAGVLGRLDPGGSGTGTYYYARYDAGAGQFQLIRNLNGAAAVLGTYSQTLTVGSSYRLGLDMKGTTIRMLVNDVQRAAVTDSVLTAAGRAGVGFGEPGDTATQSDTQGLHLDNFSTSATLADSSGTNDGTYLGGPSGGTPGALSNDSDTAVTFDGGSESGTAARQIADDLSIELWFKSTQGIGTGAQWWEGAGMVDAEVATAANDFGVSLRSDGKVVGGVGSPTAGDVSVVSSSGGFNDGSWHHVVFTRVRSSGVIRLYVDGALLGSATASTNSLTAQPALSFGRLATGVNAYAGALDEIAVYNSALSAATISSHYAAR